MSGDDPNSDALSSQLDEAIDRAGDEFEEGTP
jgi:hypothetical protein